MATTVPPGGFAGFSQMTPASQRSLSSGLRLQRATKSRSGKKAKKRYARNQRVLKPRKKSTRQGNRPVLKKGSPEAKAFMAKLRKKRRK